MATDNASMALFCDFENIALGVRDAQYDRFDIRPVLERLLAKGSIVVKKAYCDWERYKAFKSSMHEANFELIEIPHVRQSGKNSADIRMVVDALDLCYTKAHVDTFVIISGDSDFSPLVSKLRENAKRVIGVGVKQSCSDLLVTNCDEFIYYDDLVRDREAQRAVRRERETQKRTPEEEQKRREKVEERKNKAIDLAAATFADLMADRGESERIWASVLKEVIKRRNPGFNESYFGFRTFGNLLEEAANRGLLAVGRDEKSGTFVMRAPPRATNEALTVNGDEEAVFAASDFNAVPSEVSALHGLGEVMEGTESAQETLSVTVEVVMPAASLADGTNPDGLPEPVATALAAEPATEATQTRPPRGRGRGGNNQRRQTGQGTSASQGGQGGRGRSRKSPAAASDSAAMLESEVAASSHVAAVPVPESASSMTNEPITTEVSAEKPKRAPRSRTPRTPRTARAARSSRSKGAANPADAGGAPVVSEGQPEE